MIALCASGIIIRALAPLLQNKRIEPPVLAVAEDGSAVVPLLGGLSGVNDIARTIAHALEVAPAITTTGELRFGINLLHPPTELTLANPDSAKTFMSDLLAGQTLQINGNSRWLTASKLPLADDGQLTISITPETRTPQANELIYHPRTVAVSIEKPTEDLASLIGQAFDNADLSIDSLALLLAHEKDYASPHIHQVSKALKAPLRFVAGDADLAKTSVESPVKHIVTENLTLAVAAAPADVLFIGRKRGKLTVIGLGPGSRDLMTPAVQRDLEQAEDVLGYETYVRMAGPSATNRSFT